jgi:hypothetical protein
MTSQDIHRALYLGKDVLRHFIHRQVRRARSVPRPVAQHVGYLHLPPDVLQILLEPAPGQLAGLQSVEQQDGPVLRHSVIHPTCPAAKDVNTGAQAPNWDARRRRK